MTDSGDYNVNDGPNNCRLITIILLLYLFVKMTGENLEWLMLEKINTIFVHSIRR